MFSNIRATIQRVSEMTFDNISKLKFWAKTSLTSFDVSTLTSQMRVASVTVNGNTVAYYPIEKVLLVSYVITPEMSQSEAQEAGNALDLAIQTHAHSVGADKYLFLVSKDVPPLPGDDYIEFRAYVRNVSQAFKPLETDHALPQLYIN